MHQEFPILFNIAMGFSEGSIERYADAVRRSHYDLSSSTGAKQQALESLLTEEKQNE
ncbi:hypothetical protein [Ktedonobacter racemifer]|uniref:Uncharacterized protein n=1 Tax=Ktedonobacter racemifer DSM 44963 TaxID=485913 RepID=D6TTR4_KTERA|nr:hypothetical protein [Ktedonobacter racemifer]EFH83815.1 hypothetical protein Krac_4812 [Ktedonobacter racemifer DSM 44963]